MKILHALVGYLAVTALPFNSFAFTSPLAAIEYDHNDGYVNISAQNQIDNALMKHVLGSVVETCQTVSTQYYADSALMRVPGDIVKARQAEEALAFAPKILIVFTIVALVSLSIVWIESDDPKRKRFTAGTVSKTIAQYPKFNWIICHSPYAFEFEGDEDTDWGHTHHELKISFGRTIGYDLYWARSGTFYRYGDSGFINWAYNGNIISTEAGGSIVNFGTIS